MTLRARNGCGWRAESARTPQWLITMSKRRSSVAGWSAALNALFLAKHPIDAGVPEKLLAERLYFDDETVKQINGQADAASVREFGDRQMAAAK
jgi:hypothetical protein